VRSITEKVLSFNFGDVQITTKPNQINILRMRTFIVWSRNNLSQLITRLIA